MATGQESVIGGGGGGQNLPLLKGRGRSLKEAGKGLNLLRKEDGGPGQAHKADSFYDKSDLRPGTKEGVCIQRRVLFPLLT